MTRIIQNHPTLAERSLPHLVLVVLVAALLLGGVASAHAALTTESCLAKKLNEWGNLRKCQAGENAKKLQAKPFDLAKCQTKFDLKLGKLTQQATAAAIACRYAVNGDGTVTDYDTGLQWEQKTTTVGSGVNLADPHDVDNQYSWATFIKTDGTGFLDGVNNCTSTNGTTVTTAGFAGHCDWRLPTIQELQTILDETQAICVGAGGGACIDPVFGPTVSYCFYWSATTFGGGTPLTAWRLRFDDGVVFDDNKAADDNCVRAVRTGL